MPKIGERQTDIEKVIFRAVVGNEIEVLKDLHDRGADFNVFEPSAGNTPLHIACSIGMRVSSFFRFFSSPSPRTNESESESENQISRLNCANRSNLNYFAFSFFSCFF